MQRRHNEEQQLQAHLKEVAEACHIEHTAQKARKIAEAKMREEAKKTEDSRGEEEEEMDGVPLTTPEQGISEGCCPLEGHSRFPGYKN